MNLRLKWTGGPDDGPLEPNCATSTHSLTLEAVVGNAMSDEAALLQAIRDHPDDDTVRLAYADWLEEHDDPRAEFIRLCHQQKELTGRTHELSAQFDLEWLKSIGVPRFGADRISLKSGRQLHLMELRQWYISENSLGLPNVQINREIVARIVSVERERIRGVGSPYLIEPQQRYHSQRDSHLPSELRKALIPAFACVGRFKSYEPARDMTHEHSELTVIWFQEEPAPPFDPAVREQIRTLDWDRLATDGSW